MEDDASCFFDGCRNSDAVADPNRASRARRNASRWPRPPASRTSASNSGLNGVTTPFVAARLDRAGSTHAALRQDHDIRGFFTMKTFKLSRALRAALIGMAVIGSAGIARADIKDYEFKLIEPTVAIGKDKIVTLQLV